MIAHEKAAWVFVPPEAAQENTHDDSTAQQKRLTTIIALMALALRIWCAMPSLWRAAK